MKITGAKRALHLACLGMAALAGLPFGAHAMGNPAPQPNAGKYFIKTNLANLYLDAVAGESDAGTLTQLRGKSSGSRDIWELIPVGNGYYYIKSEMGRYLDVQWGSDDPGTLTHLWDFNGGLAQQWAVQYENPGRWVFRSRLGTYLTVKNAATTSGTPVWMMGSLGADKPAEQEWILESAGDGNLVQGFVDMHTHPMSHLGFGGKLIHGAPDVGTLMPARKNGDGCVKYGRPSTIGEALSTDNPTHGGWGFDNTCGDYLRETIVGTLEDELGASHHHHSDGAVGFPFFYGWPAHDDITHQVMWVDWIRRAHAGGLKVMVALAVNNATLAAAVMGPGDINGDDKSSTDVQVDEMILMAARNSDFMQIAYTPAQLRDIVRQGKLAVVLGMEVDNIGNFHKDAAITPQGSATAETKVHNELQRLWNKGVRYMFPIHLIDNKFGGTAIYEDFFNLSNYHQNDTWWDLVCAGSDIKHKFKKEGFDAALAAAKAVKLGIDAFREPPTPPSCTYGHRNAKDLSPLGEFAVKDMMKMGMLIDVDHMSEDAVDDVLEKAEGFGYPVNSGHNGLREGSGANENQRTAEVYQRIIGVNGMIGLGHTGKATTFVKMYRKVLEKIGSGGIGLGTDANGLWPLPGPDANAKFGSLPFSTGYRPWNYDTDGVANYGLIGDFVTSFDKAQMTSAEKANFQRSADDFATMWENAQRARLRVQ